MISIVIPTHNRCELIGRAIKSVQNQTVYDIEIIVVSDGSNDNTKNVVEKMSKKDERIKFVEYHPSKGGNVARNIGIELATGEFVAFLDDDDEWLSDKLECQLRVMNSSKSIGLVYTGVHIIYVNEKIDYIFNAKEHGNLEEKILLDNCIGTTSTVMVRRSLFEKTGGFDTELEARQDYDLWIRLCNECEVGVVSEVKINYFNYTGGNQISADTQKYENAYKKLEEKYKDLYVKLTSKQIEAKEIQKCVSLANRAMRNGDKRKARQYLLHALKIRLNYKSLIYFLLSFTNFKTILTLRKIHNVL